MPDFKTIFMLHYICVQEDGTTSQFKYDTISDEKTVLLVLWNLTHNCMVFLWYLVEKLSD